MVGKLEVYMKPETGLAFLKLMKDDDHPFMRLRLDMLRLSFFTTVCD